MDVLLLYLSEVYLRTDPEVAYNRMKSRRRPEEKEVPLSYIQLVHDCYESWLVDRASGPAPAPVLILDANRPLQEVFEAYEQNRDRILGLEAKA